MAKAFKVLFTIMVASLILLFSSSRIFQTTFLPSLSFILVMFISPLLLIASFYEMKKKPKKLLFPILGALVSLFGIILTIALITALKNFT